MPNEENGGVTGNPDDVARTTLTELLEKYGVSLADDPRRCEGLLRDLCGTCRREIHVLMTAVQERVPAELLTADDQLPLELTFGRLAKRLMDNCGLARHVATWAVESWALALGQITEEQLTPPPSPAQAGVDADLLPDTVAAPPAPIMIPLTREEIVAQRRAEGLIIKAERLLKSIPSMEDCTKQLKCAEEALSAFTEAMELLSDDDDLQKGLGEAFVQVAAASTQCGNQALRHRNYSLASSHFQRTLEIDPGHAEAESRLQAIRDNRQDFITKARLALDEGKYSSSIPVLEQVLEIFPDDPEIKTLLSDSRAAGEMVEQFMQQTLPELESQKKLFSLLELIQDMGGNGLHIPEIEQYKVSLQSRIESVSPILQQAEKSLAAGDYQQAGLDAEAILSKVADHEGALLIQGLVENHLDASRDAGHAIETAHGHHNWFQAKQLLLLHPEVIKKGDKWEELCSDIENGVVRSSHYWRFLPMVLLGLFVWLLAGLFSRMFSGGIMDAVLQQELGGAFSGSMNQSVTGQAAHLLLAFVFFPFFAAVLVGRQAMRSLGYLFIIVIAHALITAAMMWVSSKFLQDESVRLAAIFGSASDVFLSRFIYGAASGLFISQFMIRLLPQSKAKGHTSAILIGVLVASLFPLISELPSRFSPGVLISIIVFAIVFCSLLQILGLVRQWSHFSYVPISIILAYGLAMGASVAWEPYLPWINGLFMAGGVILMIAAGSGLLKIIAVLLLAPLTTLMFQFAPDIKTLPEATLLIPVWLAVWGSLANIHLDDMEPNRHFLQLFRLWKVSRSRVTLTKK